MSKENVLYLPKGQLVGLPAAGTVGLYVDSTGTFKSIDEAGTITSLGASLATSSSDGLMPQRAFASVVKFATDLTNADATIVPGTDKCSAYLLRAGVLTQGRTLTVQVTSALTNQLVYIIVEPQSFTYQINNGAAGSLATVTANAQATSWALFNNGGGQFVFSSSSYVNN